MPQTADGYYLTSYSLFTLLQGYIYCVNATTADEIPPELTEAKVTAPHPTSTPCLATPFPLPSGHVPAETQEDQGDSRGEQKRQQQVLEKSKMMLKTSFFSPELPK